MHNDVEMHSYEQFEEDMKAMADWARGRILKIFSLSRWEAGRRQRGFRIRWAICRSFSIGMKSLPPCYSI